MNGKYSIILSITIHFIFILVIVLFFPKREILKEEDSLININLTIEKNEKFTKKEEVIGTDVDIIDDRKEIVSKISTPENSSYLIEADSIQPDLVINNKHKLDSKNISNKSFNLKDFEDNLMDLMPLVEFVDDDKKEIDESFEIKWEGEKRESISNSYIDFATFPKESFTGIGVKVKFSVNSNGEVYDISIIPPGSGSVDFDILIKQYISKFIFNKSDIVSEGEINIVYKK